MMKRWDANARAMAFVVAVGALCLILTPHLPWIVKWPESWSLPVTDWIGNSLTWFLDGIKPVARVFSVALSYPMLWSKYILAETPWPLVIGCVTALGWYLGGLRMAALALLGFAFVLASGYWTQGMNTLALVAVSVPLAVLMGGLIGILAYEFPRWKSPIQTFLDVLQTVPTFAYLTPLLLLFGFGPVVGLIASAIYAAPPMARNVILGLERVDPEIKEAAVMTGGQRWQQLALIEIPTASQQIMIGFNQALMAALSMVIIAAVIGGFNDIGWEVILTMRKAEFGRSLIAGLVIVVFAIVMDRMSGTLAVDRRHYNPQITWLVLIVAAIGASVLWWQQATSTAFALFETPAAAIDASLGLFTALHGAALDGIKNGVMFYLLLPLRIGLDEAVLTFTWGFDWTPWMTGLFFATVSVLALYLAWRGKTTPALLLLLGAGALETGISQLPWPFVVTGAGVLGWRAGGRRLAILSFAGLAIILLSGLWERALLSLYLSGAAVLTCVVLGGCIGLLSAVSPVLWRVVRPICDMLQTIPLFVFLIPVLMFFQIGEFSAFVAICAYAIVPMIRYTHHGLVTTPDDLLEAAVTSGATTWQTLYEVRAPYASPTILLGVNQTINYAFSMLVIAALIGTTELGQSIFLALGQGDVGLGIAAGGAMAILALISDRILQGFAQARRAALGL